MRRAPPPSPPWLPFLETVDAPRIVYVVHQYEPQEGYTHQEPPPRNSYPGRFDLDYDGQPDAFDRQRMDALLAPVDNFQSATGAPVTVDEYGAFRWLPGAAAFLDDQIALFKARGLNHAIGEWSPSWPPFAQEVHDFNYRYGADLASRAPVKGNPLMAVLQKYWARNTLRPSNFYQQP